MLGRQRKCLVWRLFESQAASKVAKLSFLWKNMMLTIPIESHSITMKCESTHKSIWVNRLNSISRNLSKYKHFYSWVRGVLFFCIFSTHTFDGELTVCGCWQQILFACIDDPCVCRSFRLNVIHFWMYTYVCLWCVTERHSGLDYESVCVCLCGQAHKCVKIRISERLSLNSPEVSTKTSMPWHTRTQLSWGCS